MEIESVPDALQARLGHQATVCLLQLLDRAHSEKRGDVIAACSERFERRLVEEVSGLRVQIAQGECTLRGETSSLGATLRQEMADLRNALRQEMADLRDALRQEMAALESRLRQEMAGLESNLRQEMTGLERSIRGDIAAGRVEFIKWAFMFWVGQVLAITGIMGVMLRLMR